MLGPANSGSPDELGRRDVFPLLIGILSGIIICGKLLKFNFMMPYNGYQRFLFYLWPVHAIICIFDLTCFIWTETFW